MNISLDNKTDEEGVYFPEMELFLGNTNYSKSYENLVVKPFYIDKYEVSNKEYKEFVDSNGYYLKEYWPSDLMHEGISISFDQVKTSFVDRCTRIEIVAGKSDMKMSQYPKGVFLVKITYVDKFVC